LEKELSEEGFSKYGRAFQESLAHLIFEDRAFSDQIREVLNIEFFELNYLRVFISIIFDYKDKYKVHPSREIIATILKSSLDEEDKGTQKQIRDFFVRMVSSPLRDEEYVKEVSLDFCKKQKLKEAMIKSASLLQKSSFDEIKTVIDSALKLGLSNDYGHDLIKDFEFRYMPKSRDPVTTGWPRIDNISKSGLGKGELGVVIAPTGAGKSMVLTHLGCQALLDGKTVVHYTLELSEAVTGQRYDSCLSGIRLQDLFRLKEEVYDSIAEIPGTLIIKEYPTKTATTNTIRGHLEKLSKRDINVDLIIVDYGDLLKSCDKYREKRIELESIYEDLRAVAQENKCPLWTASQTNRSGLNAEVITMESISEAFNKCFVADFIFSVSRTIKDKNSNTGRIFVAKNRNGPDGLIFPLFMDTSNVKIKVLEPTGETVEEINTRSAANEAKSLKEKYKQFRNKKA
tara:strand:- start:625 stop:1995 length:1371 start_codon:yes stop_codon:yes gene_type:complete